MEAPSSAQLVPTLSLTRTDLLQTPRPISSRASLVTLPAPPAKGDRGADKSGAPAGEKARVVVGDDSGLLHCFSVRRGVVRRRYP